MQFIDTIGLEPSDCAPATFTPAAGTCPGADGQRISAGNCPTLTYFVPLFQVPAIGNETTFGADQHNRVFNGFELTARKRMSDHFARPAVHVHHRAVERVGGPTPTRSRVSPRRASRASASR